MLARTGTSRAISIPVRSGRIAAKAPASSNARTPATHRETARRGVPARFRREGVQVAAEQSGVAGGVVRRAEWSLRDERLARRQQADDAVTFRRFERLLQCKRQNRRSQNPWRTPSKEAHRSLAFHDATREITWVWNHRLRDREMGEKPKPPDRGAPEEDRPIPRIRPGNTSSCRRLLTDLYWEFVTTFRVARME